MYPEEKFHICTECKINHVDNCPDCFGFGIRSRQTEDGWIPISARDALDFLEGKISSLGWIACKTCGGNPRGTNLNGR